MFTDLIWKIVKKLFSSKFQKEFQSFYFEKIEQYRNERIESDRNIRTTELSMFINKPVICISNEWETPVIGFATSIGFISKANDPVLIVHNYLDNQEAMILGSTFYYNTQRFDALFKLDPFELCSFIYGRYTEQVFEKEIREKLLTKEEVKQLLEQNGFYNRLNLFNLYRERNPRNTAYSRRCDLNE